MPNGGPSPSGFSENVSSNFYLLCHLLGIGGYYFGDKDISIGVACELRREGGKKHTDYSHGSLHAVYKLSTFKCQYDGHFGLSF